MYKARKMLPSEFKTNADYTKRLPDGSRCLFAVESEAGHVQTGFSWGQALQLAEELSEQAVAA